MPNKSLNATPKLVLNQSTSSVQTVMAFADWARVNSMLGATISGYVAMLNY